MDAALRGTAGALRAPCALTTGLIFIRFGTRLRRVRSLQNRIGKSKHGLRITIHGFLAAVTM